MEGRSKKDTNGRGSSDASTSNSTTFDSLNLELEQITNDFKRYKARNEENMMGVYRCLNPCEDDIVHIDSDLDRAFEHLNKLLTWKKEIDMKFGKLEKNVRQNK
jgi:hypothetical protein